MKIIQLMPFHNGGTDAMKLQVPNIREHRQYDSEYIGGMALIENEVGERSIEWVVWDMDRNIRVTREYYTE